jgi:hypothetical protein
VVCPVPDMLILVFDRHLQHVWDKGSGHKALSYEQQVAPLSIPLYLRLTRFTGPGAGVGLGGQRHEPGARL